MDKRTFTTNLGPNASSGRPSPPSPSLPTYSRDLGKDLRVRVLKGRVVLPRSSDCNSGGPSPGGCGPLTSHESIEVYTQHAINSIQERALSHTLKEVRGLRDECFLHDANSRPGLLLAQAALILERLARGIPSTQESFLNLLRAARQSKSQEIGVAP